jgi:cytoskeletal protein RodZ
MMTRKGMRLAQQNADGLSRRDQIRRLGNLRTEEIEMAYEEREAEHRRIVVDTPSGRREEIHSEARQYPERSGGVSGAALAAIVVGVIALAAIIILFVMNQQQNALNANTTAQQQPPQTIIQQPAQQPPVIVQQPAPATQPPVIINGQPTTSSGTTSTTTSGPDDSSVQTAVDKKLNDDPALSALGVTATVMNGKVTLIGMVHSQSEKSQVERAVRQVKCVKSIDNQISVGD